MTFGSLHSDVSSLADWNEPFIRVSLPVGRLSLPRQVVIRVYDCDAGRSSEVFVSEGT